MKGPWHPGRLGAGLNLDRFHCALAQAIGTLLLLLYKDIDFIHADIPSVDPHS